MPRHWTSFQWPTDGEDDDRPWEPVKCRLKSPHFKWNLKKMGCSFLLWFICQMITIHPIVVSSTNVQYYSYYSESLPLMLLGEGCRGLSCSDCFTWTRRFALPPCYIYQGATVNWSCVPNHVDHQEVLFTPVVPQESSFAIPVGKWEAFVQRVTVWRYTALARGHRNPWHVAADRAERRTAEMSWNVSVWKTVENSEKLDGWKMFCSASRGSFQDNIVRKTVKMLCSKDSQTLFQKTKRGLCMHTTVVPRDCQDCRDQLVMLLWARRSQDGHWHLDHSFSPLWGVGTLYTGLGYNIASQLRRVIGCGAHTSPGCHDVQLYIVICHPASRLCASTPPFKTPF